MFLLINDATDCLHSASSFIRIPNTISFYCLVSGRVRTPEVLRLTRFPFILQCLRTHARTCGSISGCCGGTQSCTLFRVCSSGVHGPEGLEWGGVGGAGSSPQFWVINVASAEGPRGLFKNRAQLGWTHFFCSIPTAGKPADQRSRTKPASYKRSALNPLCSIQDTSFFLAEKGPDSASVPLAWGWNCSQDTKKPPRTLWSIWFPHWDLRHKGII